jgi:quercetin dioxygenase-like cupin family protein
MRQTEACPPETASVREFAVWWLRHRPLRVPSADAVRHVEGFAGVTLFRDGPFQAQLFVVRPGQRSTVHAHPNIDSVEYGLAGDGEDTFTSERNRRLGALVMIAPGEMHAAGAGAGGGAFISFQKWLNGVAPSSVELDWSGAPMDPEHAAQIGSVS